MRALASRVFAAMPSFAQVGGLGVAAREARRHHETPSRRRMSQCGKVTARVDQLVVANGRSRYGAVPQSALFGKALGMSVSSLRPVPSGFMV
jgi:hypothetical protein